MYARVYQCVCTYMYVYRHVYMCMFVVYVRCVCVCMPGSVCTLVPVQVCIVQTTTTRRHTVTAGSQVVAVVGVLLGCVVRGEECRVQKENPEAPWVGPLRSAALLSSDRSSRGHWGMWASSAVALAQEVYFTDFSNGHLRVGGGAQVEPGKHPWTETLLQMFQLYLLGGSSMGKRIDVFI